MHEVALAQELVGLIERVAKENGACRVTKARVQLGELACIVADALSFAFELARKGSLAADCTLEVSHVGLRVRCVSCDYEGPATRGEVGCPNCDAIPVEVVAGRDMRLLSIDVDDEAEDDDA